jgi:hypothetical protein
MESQSPKGKLDKIDWKNIGGLALKAALAAAVTVIAQQLSNVDFGEGTTAIVALLTVVVDALARLNKDNPAGVTNEKDAD